MLQMANAYWLPHQAWWQWQYSQHQKVGREKLFTTASRPRKQLGSEAVFLIHSVISRIHCLLTGGPCGIMRIYFCKHSGATSCNIFCCKSRGAGFQKWLYVANVASHWWQAVFWWNLPQVWQMLPIQSKWRQNMVKNLKNCLAVSSYTYTTWEWYTDI